MAGTLSVNEDWELLVSFLPGDWRTLADDTGTLKGLRKDKSVENLLRTLLQHLGCGHSLRETFADEEVLEWYRTRWQVELVFKRFKSLAQLGHLPKHDDESAKAWLYGKLLVALLVEKLIRHATAISPWGYDLATPATAQRVA